MRVGSKAFLLASFVFELTESSGAQVNCFCPRSPFLLRFFDWLDNRLYFGNGGFLLRLEDKGFLDHFLSSFVLNDLGFCNCRLGGDNFSLINDASLSLNIKFVSLAILAAALGSAETTTLAVVSAQSPARNLLEVFGSVGGITSNLCDDSLLFI